MINKIENELQWKHKSVATISLPIHGFKKDVDWNDPFYFYGNDQLNVIQLIENPDEWISKELNIHKAQLVWAVQFEMAQTVEDVLSRRTRALLLNANEAILIAPAVADIMADILGKDGQWKNDQINNFRSVAKAYTLN
jgi:glycerol-3-phosphate dehydrogenase